MLFRKGQRYPHLQLEVMSAPATTLAGTEGSGPEAARGFTGASHLIDSGGEPAHHLPLPHPAILIGAFFGITGSHVHGILYA